jgi:hypothetical protein
MAELQTIKFMALFSLFLSLPMLRIETPATMPQHRIRDETFHMSNGEIKKYYDYGSL